MEIEELNNAIEILQDVIAEFPVGVNTLDDFKPIEEKIADLRKTLKAINARKITLKAIINSANSTDVSLSDFNKSFESLNQTTTNHLINTRAVKLCSLSKAIQDIIYDNASSNPIQEKVKFCLSKLFAINDKIMAQNEKRKELMKKQYKLRLECQHAIFDYQDFIKEQEARRTRQLKETNPNIIQLKEKINRSISKICTMKKLITNLIASMSKNLHEQDEEIIKMLAKHKELINLETIIEMTQYQNSSASS